MTHVGSSAASHVAYGLIKPTAWGFDLVSVLYHGDHADVRSTRSKEAPVRIVVPAKGMTAASRSQVEATTFNLEKARYLLA